MPLIVKLVLILSSGMPSNRISASASVSTRDADPADLLADLRVVGVEAALRRQVERHREARSALIQQVAVAAIGLLGGAEARILSEGPQLAAVPAREIAAGERVCPGCRRVTGPIGRSIDGLERDAGGGLNWVAHQWITYLQKMRMPIPQAGNVHWGKPAEMPRPRAKTRYTVNMALAQNENANTDLLG